jgi:hypothetical protein
LQEKEEEMRKLKDQYQIDMKLLEDKIEKKFQELFHKVDIQRLWNPSG